jgi:hypothetical protein
MNRLTWLELGSLLLLFVFAVNIGANYGPLPALLAFGIVATVGRCFIADHQVDEALARLDRPLGDVIDGHTR